CELSVLDDRCLSRVPCPRFASGMNAEQATLHAAVDCTFGCVMQMSYYHVDGEADAKEGCDAVTEGGKRARVITSILQMKGRIDPVPRRNTRLINAPQ